MSVNRIQSSIVNREELYTHLKENVSVLNNEALAQAFLAVDRKLFIPEAYESEAYEDYAVPIGFNTTILSPTRAAFMLELLQPQEGQRVLVIGSGSGWVAALIAHIVGIEGEVVGTEIEDGLIEQSRKNLEAAGIGGVTIEKAGNELGMPTSRPFHRIICLASATELPSHLLPQLTQDGIAVVPVEETLYRIVKTGEFDFEDTAYPGFLFEPLQIGALAKTSKPRNTNTI